jgi:hypothetical protein
MPTQFEPRRQGRQSSCVSTRTQSTSGTYPQSWTPESAVNKMPNAHNHRDAPPGTAVKYGNDELETIERLVDIGHYEVQVTRTTVQQQPSSAWTRSLRLDTQSHSPRLKRLSRTKRDATDFSKTAHKDCENGQCQSKPWRI